MVDAVVSSVVEQLISVVAQEAQEEVRLVAGVGKEVKKLTNNVRAIQAVLVDAEQRQVKEETVRFWLQQLKDASYEMEDVLDEWNTARLKLQIEGADNAPFAQKKVCTFFPLPCFCFKQVSLRRDIGHKIKEINEDLYEIAKAKDAFSFNVNVIKSAYKLERVQTTSLIDESEIYGRDDDRRTLIRKLLGESSEGLHIISIVGMGGIGKTTLAQLACNNDEVKRNFEKIIWVCVSDVFDELRIARAIIEDLEGSSSDLNEFQALIKRIKESIVKKKFLLILDDVWTEDYSKWEPFYYCLKNGFRGSKILITTRKETVAHTMRSTDIISISILSEEKCWSLFKRLAFFGWSNEECEKVEQIGRKIVGKCKGLPLAAKAIGSLLHSKKTEEEWQYILDSYLWEQEELEKGLFAPVLLSYNDLPSMVKRCFSYCAVLPKDYRISKDELIKLWMAQGYLSVKKNSEVVEIIGEEYFHFLAKRSFFQDFQKDGDGNIEWCKMHDIVHDFAQFVSKNECCAVEVRKGLEESAINSLHLKVCHSMLRLGEEVSLPVSICRFQRLRTLLIRGNFGTNFSRNNNEVLVELFSKLTSLRALDLRVNRRASMSMWITRIPTNIEKLVHLRYINLSGQLMVKLPETLCELYNLQILDVSRCKELKELPQGIGKLINLRYLLNDGTDSLWLLPEGIGRLTNLRRLTKFVHSSHGCTFESLKDLKLLRECKIERLGNVSNVGEAKRRELEKKKNLLVLVLHFDREGDRKNEEDVQLLEALQPPLNLKELEIRYFRGNSISPNWMKSLTNMRLLRLSECKNCEHLPPLGKLPSLERLFIREMQSVKKVGNEFLGIESSSSSTICFPKLKSLTLGWMYEWEEWEYGIERKGEIMPRLSELEICGCHKLKALPAHILRTTTLQRLEIRSCDILTARYRRGTGEDWPKISRIPDVKINEQQRMPWIFFGGLPPILAPAEMKLR